MLGCGEDNFVEMVLSLYLYVGSEDQTPVLAASAFSAIQPPCRSRMLLLNLNRYVLSEKITMNQKLKKCQRTWLLPSFRNLITFFPKGGLGSQKPMSE